ncbi:MAG: nitroreductase family protein [Anaerolineae bacterium]|nr:nitroreductase family protein [Anaerolineae bacterium]
MDTLETIIERRSVRRYRPEPVPPAHLQQILEAGRQAPSAGNRQPWHFVVVRDPQHRRQLAQACNGQLWMADAACILVAVGLPQVSAKWHSVDVAIALQNIVLAARSLGYGTCWVGAFDPEAVRELCAIPGEAQILACTPLGVPEAWPAPKPRKGWDEVFSAERWGQPLSVTAE